MYNSNQRPERFYIEVCYVDREEKSMGKGITFYRVPALFANIDNAYVCRYSILFHSDVVAIARNKGSTNYNKKRALKDVEGHFWFVKGPHWDSKMKIRSVALLSDKTEVVRVVDTPWTTMGMEIIDIRIALVEPYEYDPKHFDDLQFEDPHKTDGKLNCLNWEYNYSGGAPAEENPPPQNYDGYIGEIADLYKPYSPPPLLMSTDWNSPSYYWDIINGTLSEPKIQYTPRRKY